MPKQYIRKRWRTERYNWIEAKRDHRYKKVLQRTFMNGVFIDHWTIGEFYKKAKTNGWVHESVSQDCFYRRTRVFGWPLQAAVTTPVHSKRALAALLREWVKNPKRKAPMAVVKERLAYRNMPLPHAAVIPGYIDQEAADFHSISLPVLKLWARLVRREQRKMGIPRIADPRFFEFQDILHITGGKTQALCISKESPQSASSQALIDEGKHPADAYWADSFCYMSASAAIQDFKARGLEPVVGYPTIMNRYRKKNWDFFVAAFTPAGESIGEPINARDS